MFFCDNYQSSHSSWSRVPHNQIINGYQFNEVIKTASKFGFSPIRNKICTTSLNYKSKSENISYDGLGCFRSNTYFEVKE